MPFVIAQATFWDHGSDKFTPVEQPTWEAVAAELARGRSASLAGSDIDLDAGTAAFGTITLQRHHAGWLVTAQPLRAENPVWLTDPARSKMPAALGCCGGARVPGKYIVPDAPAAAAARHFFATGACTPDLAWVPDPPA